jgi:hypothetical protein
MDKILLFLLRAVLHRVEQQLIHPGDARQLLRIAVIILAFTFINGAHLPRIGHNHAAAQLLQITADPRTVGSHLHNEKRSGPRRRERPQRHAFIGNAFPAVHSSRRIEHADRVLFIPQIEPHRHWPGRNASG